MKFQYALLTMYEKYMYIKNTDSILNNSGLIFLKNIFSIWKIAYKTYATEAK